MSGGVWTPGDGPEPSYMTGAPMHDVTAEEARIIEQSIAIAEELDALLKNRLPLSFPPIGDN